MYLQGFNVERLNRDMRTFDLQTTFEEVFPVQGATVEEYLQQVSNHNVWSGYFCDGNYS